MGTADDTCIEFDDVVAGYGEFMILNNLSLKAKRGRITLLLGPNGAGKSTVLKTLFGLLKVRQGRVRLDGQDEAWLTEQWTAGWPAVGLSMFPFILPSTIDAQSSLTVWNSSSSHLTLFIMLVCTVVFLPLILLYTAWVYKVMFGRSTTGALKTNPDLY